MPDSNPGSDREPYVTPHPMPPDRIRPDHLVHVPVWVRGQVIGWDTARVLANHTVPGNDPYFIVRFVAPGAPYDAQDVGYFGYSIECGVCRGGTHESCRQCRSPSMTADPVRRVHLDLRTNVITQAEMDHLHAAPLRVIQHEYGAWVHVPPDADALTMRDGGPRSEWVDFPNLRRLLIRARPLGASWINLDRDADDTFPDLPTYDW